MKNKLDLNTLDKENSDKWGGIISEKPNLYPDENVVRFLAKNFADKETNSNKKALDIGFGTGRHLKLLQDYNFQIFGIDYSEKSCETARKNFGLNDQIQNTNLKDFNAQKENFDLIVAYGVLFYYPCYKILENLKLIHYLLKPEGKLLVNFRTTKDILFISSIANNAKKLVRKAGFKIDDIQRLDYYKTNLKYPNSWWIYTLSK